MKERHLITAKFGGSSLADADQFRKVKAIIDADPARRYVVPSAPGKRCSSDTKVTDLLYQCEANAYDDIEFEKVMAQIRTRYQEIIDDLGLTLSLEKELNEIEYAIKAGAGKEYAASRGEYLNGIILAAYLGFEFLDAARLIHFTVDGHFDEVKTARFMKEKLTKVKCAVIPGFYGADDGGNIHTFSRGGSDVTGALVARATQSDLYENWTDVSGFLLTDPRIIENPKQIPYMTFAELRELSYRGASVLHEEAVYPVRMAGIPINIRNTNRPQDAGTMICKNVDPDNVGPITGIAGKKQFVAISIAKNGMNSQVGFCRKLLEAFDNNQIAFEHMPSGIDTISVILQKNEYDEKQKIIMNTLKDVLEPDKIEVDDDLALVTVVGKGMRSESGIAARFFTSLGVAEVNIKMIDMGSNEINCTIGVSNQDFEKAISALYNALVK